MLLSVLDKLLFLFKWADILLLSTVILSIIFLLDLEIPGLVKFKSLSL